MHCLTLEWSQTTFSTRKKYTRKRSLICSSFLSKVQNEGIIKALAPCCVLTENLLFSSSIKKKQKRFKIKNNLCASVGNTICDRESEFLNFGYCLQHWLHSQPMIWWHYHPLAMTGVHRTILTMNLQCFTFCLSIYKEDPKTRAKDDCGIPNQYSRSMGCSDQSSSGLQQL